jgi:hypothetical protein
MKILLFSCLLLPLLYIGLYFVVLALPPSIRLPSLLAARPSGIQSKYVEVNGTWSVYPDYRGLPGWFFTSIHEYDRTHLRPSRWGGTYPRNEELSFEWLLGPSASAKGAH